MEYNNKKLGTFSLNKKEPVHRWYKYDEGYSSDFIYKEIEKLPVHPKSLFEPFSGSGTTPFVSSYLGIESYFTEMNPFMSFVSKVKTSIFLNPKEKLEHIINELNHFLLKINLDSEKVNFEKDANADLNGFEKFYSKSVLNKLLFIRKKIYEIESEEEKDLLLLALASILVRTSNMKKHGDLRYAKEGEKKESDYDVFNHFNNKVNEIIEDIEELIDNNFVSSNYIGDDARLAKIDNPVDCIITSPPYLNGTNYIRNTKLELNMLGFVKEEKDLKEFHSKGIIAGINNVSNRRKVINKLEFLNPILEELEPVSYDVRISKMIIGYFNDMADFFENSSNILKKEGYLILDIGDSQFAGVHIKTHELLSRIAKNYGFDLYDEEILRTRRSKNQMILSQRVLRFKLQ